MLKISIMILVLLWCQYGHAQNKNILLIKDAIINQTLSGVYIYTEEMNSVHTTSDSLGNATILITNNKTLYLHFSMIDYLEKIDTIISTIHSDPLNIYLSPTEDEAEKVLVHYKRAIAPLPTQHLE